MSKMTEQQMIAVMYNLQDTFNKKVHPQWETQNYDWARAIKIENAEAQESFKGSWCWWKKGVDDYNNYKVEIVDTWHFVMSLDQVESINIGMADGYEGLTHNPRNWDMYVEEMIDDIDAYHPTINTDPNFILGRLDDLMCITYDVAGGTESLDLVTEVLRVWKETCGTMDDLYKLYIGKNVLNFLRQNNNYKTGEYKKMWNGVEDNVVMTQILDELEPSEHLFDIMYDRLSLVYTKL